MSALNTKPSAAKPTLKLCGKTAKFKVSALAAAVTLSVTTLRNFRQLFMRQGATHEGTLREVHRADKLLLDFDGPPPPFPALLSGLFHLGLTPRALYYAPSHSRGHWHVVIYLCAPLPLLATLFCQLWLGSDAERERNNFVRAYHFGRKDKYVQILFNQKVKT